MFPFKKKNDPLVTLCADLRDKRDELVFENQKLQDHVVRLSDELKAVASSVEKRSVDAEDKLQAVYRLLSGEDEARCLEFRRQIANRLALSSPDIDRIYERCDALQRLAVVKGEINRLLGSIDVEDLGFEYAEDLDALTAAQKLAGE